MPFEMALRFADPIQRETLSDAQLDEALATWQQVRDHFLACLVSTTTDLNFLQQEYARRHPAGPAPTHYALSLVRSSPEAQNTDLSPAHENAVRQKKGSTDDH